MWGDVSLLNLDGKLARTNIRMKSWAFLPPALSSLIRYFFSVAKGYAQDSELVEELHPAVDESEVCITAETNYLRRRSPLWSTCILREGDEPIVARDDRNEFLPPLSCNPSSDLIKPVMIRHA